MKILFKHCDSDDVATRDTVAEVLGKLAPVRHILVAALILTLVKSFNNCE